MFIVSDSVSVACALQESRSQVIFRLPEDPGLRFGPRDPNRGSSRIVYKTISMALLVPDGVSRRSLKHGSAMRFADIFST